MLKAILKMKIFSMNDGKARQRFGVNLKDFTVPVADRNYRR